MKKARQIYINRTDGTTGLAAGAEEGLLVGQAGAQQNGVDNSPDWAAVGRFAIALTADLLIHRAHIMASAAVDAAQRFAVAPIENAAAPVVYQDEVDLAGAIDLRWGGAAELGDISGQGIAPSAERIRFDQQMQIFGIGHNLLDAQ